MHTTPTQLDNNFLLSIINALPISIIVIDKSFNIVFLNDFVRENQPEPFPLPTPLKCYQFSHQQDSPCDDENHVCPHHVVFSSRKSFTVKHVHSDSKNNQQTVEVTAIPLFNGSGEVEYIVEVTKDISLQVDIETALQSVFIGTSTEVGNNFFKSLASHLAKALGVKYVLIGELIKNNKILTHAVWQGTDIAENFIYDLAHTPCEKVIGSSICSFPNNIQQEFPKDHLLSEMNACSYIGAPLMDAEGTVNGILAVLDVKPLRNEEMSKKLLNVFAARAGAELGRKISEKKQRDLERKLTHAQKMESLGTLAGGIAHDFNNILTAIIGYSELSLKDLNEGSLLHGNLQKILSAGNRAKDLVQQILAFSRQSEPEMLPVNVKTIILEVIKFVKATLPSYIEIHSTLESDQIVLADPSQIHRVLMNICTNAGHAMLERGGNMIVTLDSVDKTFCQKNPDLDLPGGNYARITISDTGEGIPDENLLRIFDPYFSTKPTGKGTGLGLATALGIVHTHHGRIHVTSKIGHGSQFDIYLPTIEKNVLIQHQSSTPIIGGNEHILLVDDEEDVLGIHEKLLLDLGYSTTTCLNSTEALETFKKDFMKFDLVLTDLTMPKLAGDKLAKELLKIRKDIPILICSGFSSSLKKEKFLTIGVTNVLWKPLNSETLANEIRSAIDSSRTQSSP